MNRQKYILGGVALVLMGLTAGLLMQLRIHQRLGDPGVKTRPIPGGKTLEILMPETVPGYTSEILTNVETVLGVLPADTSFRSRAYKGEDHTFIEITTVLMGSDRTSIHSPQICLPGQGWAIDDSKTRVENIPIERPFPYQLPVNKLIATKQVKDETGAVQTYSSVYLYWFVDGNQYTASGWKRKPWLVPHDLLTTGVLDRWAYIACFETCLPGQEEATFDHMKKMIADALPEFQLVPHAAR